MGRKKLEPDIEQIDRIIALELEGKSYTEIAKILGISVSSLRVRRQTQEYRYARFCAIADRNERNLLYVQSLRVEAINVAAELMRDEAIPSAVRLRAAERIYEWGDSPISRDTVEEAMLNLVSWGILPKHFADPLMIERLHAIDQILAIAPGEREKPK